MDFADRLDMMDDDCDIEGFPNLKEDKQIDSEQAIRIFSDILENKGEISKLSYIRPVYIEAALSALREALKGAQIIAEQAKGHIAENERLQAELKNLQSAQVTHYCENCEKLTADLTRYKTAEAKGWIRWLPDTGIGDLSDGYHTFNELYHHRAVLFSVICNLYLSRAWKSKKHHDGTMFDGMFIVGINTPYGQATYHYDIKPYWDYFGCLERDLAPEWDGHTPNEAIERLLKLGSLDSAQAALEAQWE